jgi:hypothetical protein
MNAHARPGIAPNRSTGGSPVSDLPGVLARFPKAQIVYGLASGQIGAFAVTEANKDVWLVALSSSSDPRPANLYESAVAFGLTGEWKGSCLAASEATGRW